SLNSVSKNCFFMCPRFSVSRHPAQPRHGIDGAAVSLQHVRSNAQVVLARALHAVVTGADERVSLAQHPDSRPLAAARRTPRAAVAHESLPNQRTSPSARVLMEHPKSDLQLVVRRSGAAARRDEVEHEPLVARGGRTLGFGSCFAGLAATHEWHS